MQNARKGFVAARTAWWQKVIHRGKGCITEWGGSSKPAMTQKKEMRVIRHPVGKTVLSR